MASITDFKCLHCSASVTVTEIKDGWCDTCGKKIPFSLQSEVNKMGSLPLQPRDDYDEPKPGSGRRLLISTLVLLALLGTAAFLILKAS